MKGYTIYSNSAIDFLPWIVSLQKLLFSIYYIKVELLWQLNEILFIFQVQKRKYGRLKTITIWKPRNFGTKHKTFKTNILLNNWWVKVGPEHTVKCFLWIYLENLGTWKCHAPSEKIWIHCGAAFWIECRVNILMHVARCNKGEVCIQWV